MAVVDPYVTAGKTIAGELSDDQQVLSDIFEIPFLCDPDKAITIRISPVARQ